MTGAARQGVGAARAAFALALAAVAGAFVACAEPVTMQPAEPRPPTLNVSVHRSVLLGDHANPPLWTWTVDAVVRVASVEVSVDGEPYRSLHPAARSYRPSQPLLPGRPRLTVRVTTAGDAPAAVTAFAHARVVVLPGRPPVPDDPCYRAAGGPVRCGDSGANAGQWPLRQIRMPELWQALEQGVPGEPRRVVVAVLDTGYTHHPDLQSNLVAAAGYDFVSASGAAGDGGGIDPDAADPGTGGSWHGTAIAGVIAAVADNGTGLAGMGWPWGRSRVTIMPVRVVGPNGATTYDVAQGLRYAAGLPNDSGTTPPIPARIINLSLAGPGPPDEVLEEALRDVTAAGTVVVAAAGNHGSVVAAPANSAQTLAVGAVAVDGTLSPMSNRGPEIDIVAPGGDDSHAIPTLAVGRGEGPSRWVVRPDHGTSIAAAHVSGALALLAGLGGTLTLDGARLLLADAAIDLGPPGRDGCFGPGLLDAFALVGAYPVRAAAVGPSSRCNTAPGSAAPAVARSDRTDPHTLIVRYRNRRMDAAASESTGDMLRVRYAVAGVESGTDGYALIQLSGGQDREQVKVQLDADPAVAGVYDNRIYLPAVAPAHYPVRYRRPAHALAGRR